LDQEKYREKIAQVIVKNNYPFSFIINRLPNLTIQHVVQLINRLPSPLLKSKCPYEFLFKVTPYESRFRSNTLQVNKMNKQNLEVNLIRERRVVDDFWFERGNESPASLKKGSHGFTYCLAHIRKF
jgi:hypothetical protein